MADQLRGNQCRKCKKTHEKCADGKRCENWRISYDVCIIFGSRPAKAGFDGARVS